MNITKGNTSILSRDLLIKGNLKSEGIIEIEGTIEGDIDGDIITIRESGNVKGNIKSKILNVKGLFNGNIKSERINISGKADIKGTLEYISLCVEDGASIEGDLKRVNDINKKTLTSSTKEEKKEENK